MWIFPAFYNKSKFYTDTKNKKMEQKEEKLINLVYEYFKNHPYCLNISCISKLLKLSYSQYIPTINQTSIIESYFSIANLPCSETQHVNSKQNCELLYDHEKNILKENNSFEGIHVGQTYEKIMVDHVFGTPSLSGDGNRWVYIAKKKSKKVRSYFLGGNGQEVYRKDFGENLQDVNDVGVFIWDIKLKKIIEIGINIEGDSDQYIFANPKFADKEGNLLICSAYKRNDFILGLADMFNRISFLFQISINPIGQKWEFNSIILKTKNRTNLYPNVSRCTNYLMYYEGGGITHNYYMDLVVMRKKEGKWEEIMRKEEEFTGYGYIAKTESYEEEGVAYFYYQTIKEGKQIIKQINCKSGEVITVAQEQGKSFNIIRVSHENGLLLGRVNSLRGSQFFMKPFKGQIYFIPPNKREQLPINFEQISKPFPAFYLQGKNQNDEQKKSKKPLVVMLHGGPHGFSEPTLNLIRFMLIKMGYAILLPNFTGSTGYGQQYLYQIVGKMGEVNGPQIIEMLDFLLEQKPHLDKRKIHLYGFSYGGYLAAYLGSKYSQHFKSAILLNGLFQFSELLMTCIPDYLQQVIDQKQYWELTLEDYQRMMELNPQPIKIPTIQLSGKLDQVVFYKYGLFYQAQCKKHGTSFKTYVYDNSGHDLSANYDESIDIAIKILLFLQEFQDQPQL